MDTPFINFKGGMTSEQHEKTSYSQSEKKKNL